MFKSPDGAAAAEELDRWLNKACHSRTEEVKELSKEARRHRKAIVRAVELGISNARVEAQRAHVAARARADGGDGRGGPRAASVPALDVGGVEPDVGIARIREVALPRVGDRVVERGARPRHPACAHAAHAHGLRHAPRPPGGSPVGHHLGDRGDDHAARARVAPDQVLGEAAPRARLRNPQVDGAHGGGEPALAVAVPLVAGLACLVGLGVHGLVDKRLGHHPYELGHAHHAVVESRH